MIPSHPLISKVPALADWDLDILFKSIKHIYFRIYPEKRLIRISAPKRVNRRELDRVIQGKLPWLEAQVRRLENRRQQAVSTPTPFQYTTGEVHTVAGVSHALRRVHGRAGVELSSDGELILSAPDGIDTAGLAKILEHWHRRDLLDRAREMVTHWEPVMGVQVNELRIRRMKTRWGSCNIRVGRIWLNLALAHAHPQLLEYVVVHEMVHLLEAGHNRRFYGFMDRFLPSWRVSKDQLNRQVLLR